MNIVRQERNILFEIILLNLFSTPAPVNTMMEELDDQEDTRSMEVLSPPENMFPHRGSSDTCKLGSKTYCPGEVLFR